MYSFEGQYRSRPIQSLGGSSKKEPKHILLQRTEAERKKRENLRKQLTSATVIQSFYRACKVREKLKNVERQAFDDIVGRTDASTGAKFVSVLPELWRKLLFFFNSRQDGSRLIWFCQACIKHQSLVTNWICKNSPISVHNIQRLLWICCKHVESIAAGSAPLALPLRMLEIYTQASSYTKSTPKSNADSLVYQILGFLIRKGYYASMRVLITEKVPSSLEPNTVTPPTPMAGSVLELVRKPLTILGNTDNTQLRDTVLVSLCRELFCPAHSDQIRCFILPALSCPPGPGARGFPFTALLSALTGSGTEDKAALPELQVEGSLWLLYTVLSLGEKHIDQLSPCDMRLYLGVLQRLACHLEPPRSRYHALDTDETDSDDDGQHGMDIDYVSGGNSVTETQRVCVSLLDRPAHVRCILVCVRHQAGDVGAILALCRVCHVLMAHRKMPIHSTRLLYSLAFSPWFIQRLWRTCSYVSTDTVTGSKMSLLQLLSGGLTMTPQQRHTIVPLLSVFSSMFSHSLFSLHDAEFYGESKTNDPQTYMPFQLSDLVPMSQLLRDACLGIIELAHPDTKAAFRTSGYRAVLGAVPGTGAPSDEELYRLRETYAYLFKVLSQLIKQLYSRDSRRAFCPQDHWLSSRVTIVADKPSQIYHIESEAFQRRPFGERSALNPRRHLDEEGPPMSTTEVRNITILTEMPFVVAFEERVKIMQKLLNLDHVQHQRDARHFNVGPMINITVRRSYLYEDAFDRLSRDNEPNLKLKVQVQLKNFQGLDEAGIDGGGIFREFMNELLKTAFDPNRGFFKYTNDKTLYPSPQAKMLVENYTEHYFFLGRILGKALYENMLVELPFASFFLNKILSRRGGDVDIHHLASLDPEMYKNLLFLKNYEDDVSDLGLDFTVVNNDLGEAQIEDLKPNGRQIPVTSHNRIEYIHLMADYRLNKQIRVHCHAFRQGLADVINIDWLRMFDHNELQVLISGAQIPIDTGDLRRHTNYSGGYNEDHPAILTFWRVVESFTDEQKRRLVKFVTSCSRPPLLGFKDLYPPFCVQYAGNEADRLPSASTCMNLLKLPEFATQDLMREKLQYAIESGAGFELS